MKIYWFAAPRLCSRCRQGECCPSHHLLIWHCKSTPAPSLTQSHSLSPLLFFSSASTAVNRGNPARGIYSWHIYCLKETRREAVLACLCFEFPPCVPQVRRKQKKSLLFFLFSFVSTSLPSATPSSCLFLSLCSLPFRSLLFSPSRHSPRHPTWHLHPCSSVVRPAAHDQLDDVHTGEKQGDMARNDRPDRPRVHVALQRTQRNTRRQQQQRNKENNKSGNVTHALDFAALFCFFTLTTHAPCSSISLVHTHLYSVNGETSRIRVLYNADGPREAVVRPSYLFPPV